MKEIVSHPTSQRSLTVATLNWDKLTSMSTDNRAAWGGGEQMSASLDMAATMTRLTAALPQGIEIGSHFWYKRRALCAVVFSRFGRGAE